MGILAGIFSLLDPGNAGSNSMMPSSGAAGPSSSNPGPRLDVDLNLPPADAPEPETPEEEVRLQGRPDGLSYKPEIKGKISSEFESREAVRTSGKTAELKRKIFDRMAELDDPLHASFWVEQRFRLVTEALLTNKEQRIKNLNIFKIFWSNEKENV